MWSCSWIVRKFWPKSRLKLRRANRKPCSSMLNIWTLLLKSLDGSAPPILLHATYISFLGWDQSLYSVLLHRYLMSLASQTSWGLQCQPGFTFIPSYNGYFGSLELSSHHYAGTPLVNGGSLKSENWWPPHSCTLHTSKANITMWTLPSLVATLV